MIIERGYLESVTEKDLTDGKIVIPKSVFIVKYFAFNNLRDVKSVVFKNQTTEIGVNAFDGCVNLKKAKLPSKTEFIGKYAFANCESLKSVKISKNIRKLKPYTFLNCKNLTSINIPPKVRYIEKGVFENCTSLKKIKLHDKVRLIEDDAFKNCSSLTQINLPSSVEKLSNGLFAGCKRLKKVTMKDHINTIGESCFSDCSSLKKITIPIRVSSLCDKAFSNCTSLQSVKFPDGLQTIGKNTFENCSSIKQLNLPSELMFIKDGAFKNCTGLESININAREIGNGAFENCSSLKEVNFTQNNIQEICDNAFAGCTSLEKITIPRFVNKIGKIGNDNIKYFTKNEKIDGFILSSKPSEDSIALDTIKISPAILSKYWDHKKILLNEQNNDNICDFYNNFLNEIHIYDASDLIENHNFKFFKKYSINTENDNKNFYKLLYNLGGFEKEKVVGDKKVNYSQKVNEFLLLKISKNETNIEQLNAIAKNMSVSGAKDEFTEFFIKNFDELLKEEKQNEGFISKCYDMFDEVQLTNTSNRGSQRQLKPTVQKFKDYFETGKFRNVTPDNIEIARTISPYFSDQGVFEDAVEINNERIENKVPNNILNIPLKEEVKETPFDEIDKLSGKITDLQKDTLSNMVEMAGNEFSWEWLEKNDPKNFILGKLCSCCAHLEGMGYSIMHASIIHPDVQNMVIRNKKGTIIAKSTLYVNRKEGYGVFNNVEVYDKIPDEEKEQIYKKYIEGVSAFAEEYNRENPNAPLKQINVGMHFNDLNDIIVFNKNKSAKILPAVDYSEYGYPWHNYDGDSSECQYVIWKKPGEKTTEKEPDEFDHLVYNK